MFPPKINPAIDYILPQSKYQILNSGTKTHIVCPALKKGKVSYELLVESNMFSLDDYFMYCDIVNKKAEVGCFYPRKNVSLLPLFRENSLLPMEQELLKKYLDDTFVANQDYLECSNMIFAFDDHIWKQKSDLESEIKKASEVHFEKFKSKNVPNSEYFLKNIEIHIL